MLCAYGSHDSNLAVFRTEGTIMEHEEISQEVKNRAKACKTPEEVLVFAKDDFNPHLRHSRPFR